MSSSHCLVKHFIKIIILNHCPGSSRVVVSYGRNMQHYDLFCVEFLFTKSTLFASCRTRIFAAALWQDFNAMVEKRLP